MMPRATRKGFVIIFANSCIIFLSRVTNLTAIVSNHVSALSLILFLCISGSSNKTKHCRVGSLLTCVLRI